MVTRETRGTRRGQALGCAVVTGALLVAGVVPAGAVLTPRGCLAKKVKAWGNLRELI
jgi:hypothetical protein